MSDFRRRLYGAVVRMHPADFRDEFGCEMILDFEDALESHGFASLCFDALLSLGRQWAVCILPGEVVQGPNTRPSLLAGQYVMVSQGCLTLFDLARASVVCVMLLLAIGSAATAPSGRIMTDLQAGSGSHDKTIDSSGKNRSTTGERFNSHVRRAAIFTASDRGRQADDERRRVRREEAEGLRLNMTSRHMSSTGSALGIRLRQWTAIAFVAGMMMLLRGNPRIGRKVILAALGLLAMVAPMAFGIIRMIPMYTQILHASGPLPSFEVATIRPWRRPPTPPPPPPSPSPDGIAAPNPALPDKVAPLNTRGQTTDRVHSILTMRLLIAFAYNVPFGYERIRVVGGPDWLGSDDYEIQAKIEDSQYVAMQKMTPAQQREQVSLMEQSLLLDRLKLKVHFEMREMPAYALVIAKGGPKLRPANDGESTRLSVHQNEMTATAISIDQWIHSPFLGGRVVVDQTGLTGSYDFTLTWSEQSVASGAGPESGTDAPSLFTAVQEQLGLKLIPTKAPVEVIVVDSVERPSAN